MPANERSSVDIPENELAMLAMGLQLRLFTAEQLDQSLQVWLGDRSQSVVERLVQQGSLREADRANLQSMVGRDGALTQLGTGAVGQRAKDAQAAESIDHTLRDARPGESLDSQESDGPRLPRLSVLNESHQRFRILRPHAKGGLGVVSVAHDVELDREVAVKEMRRDRSTEDDVQRFMIEARVTGQLDHPGIPPVYALGYFEDGRPFYVMRLVDGKTLKDAIEQLDKRFPAPDTSRQRSFQLRQLLGALVSVCNTLRYAHSRGVLHRDIKPSNIMLGGFGETILLDWGLAKSQEQSQPFSVLDAKAHHVGRRTDDPDDTGTGSVLGTPHYMSPEQAVGDVNSINLRSEVYSIGATLYHVLTGKPPFTGKTRAEVLEQVRRGDFKPPRLMDRRVPPALDAICMKAMSMDRGDRFADTGELATEIEHWLADEPVSCYSEPQTQRWQRWARTNQVWVAGLIVLMATGFVGLAVGTVMVSIKDRQATEASQRAALATATAETITKESRQAISETFITSFNNQMRNVPGTERSRLLVLQNFIALFEKWERSKPYNVEDRFELAMTIRERAFLHIELGKLDQAWSDLLLAKSIFDELIKVPGDEFNGQVLSNRLLLMTDIASLLQELKPDDPQTSQFIQDAYFWIRESYQRQPSVRQYQLSMARVLDQLSIINERNGRSLEACELMDQASALYAELLLKGPEDESGSAVVQGYSIIGQYACRCKNRRAHQAIVLGERDLAFEIAMDAYSLCNSLLQRAPEDIKLRAAKLDTALLICSLKKASTLALRRALISEITGNVKSVAMLRREQPSNRAINQLYVDGLLLLASSELLNGSLQLAMERAEEALLQIDLSLEKQVTSDLKEKLRCHRLLAEISEALGDGQSSSLHGFEAAKINLQFHNLE